LGIKWDSPDRTPARRGHRHFRSVKTAIYLISLIVLVGTVLPASVRAGVFADVWAALNNTASADQHSGQKTNVQTMPLLKPAMNVDPSAARGGGDITIVDDSALVPEEGPAGTIADISKPRNSTISTYIVRPGDTLSEIAEMFEVSPSTILWANDLPRGAKLQVGQKLTILPVTGVRYTVKKGDTLSGIAKKYGADEEEIASFNGIDALSVGAEIIIPDGEIHVAAPARPVSGGARPIAHGGSPAQIGYYIRPISGGVRSQGIHGYNGVDLAGVPTGSEVVAAASGEVIVAKQGGWNGGYGNYVVVQHDNGSQTLYAHLSSVTVSSGQSVVQGQVLGGVGSTGKSTGTHLHFEIRNGVRNPF
jgi:LysM repeat protein